MLFFIIAVFVSIIISTNFILKIQVNSLEKVHSLEQMQPSYQELKKYESEFKQMNSEVDLFHDIQQSNLRWLSVFYDLDSIVTEKIILTDLITKDYSITLLGKADTRNDLLKLQESINISECFSNAIVPLSNLVFKENVAFQIIFKVNDDCLRGIVVAKKETENPVDEDLINQPEEIANEEVISEE
ncbi:MAG TPA: hypothetical protein ENH06_01455 [bacterium]|nr:hypothetical protein [bacterium]